MNLLEIVQKLENKTSAQRFELATQILADLKISYYVQVYSSGKNIIIKPSSPTQKYVGIGSHFDVVLRSGGANDNATAMAVCFEMLVRAKKHQFKNFEVAGFIFDEEETGLKGSQAYTKEFGVGDLLGLMNLELVGQGDKFALWALNEKSKGNILENFEEIAMKNGIFSQRFDRIITNSADHVSFVDAGLNDVFTITCISDKDLEVSIEYYKAQEKDNAFAWLALSEILKKAPLFAHYHQPSDLSIHLSESTLQMTANTIWETLLAFDERDSNI
jgi:Zn-dependent M28 family amino/carboxypeptidase